MAILLDTTFLIDFLKGHRGAILFYSQHSREELFITEINAFEVITGAYARKQFSEDYLNKAHGLIQACTVIDLRRTGVIEAAKIHATLARKGLQIQSTDSLIAGIALSHGVRTIVTANITHFGRIPEIKVVTYE